VKTVLDLLKKYDQLNEAKIDRGKLSPEEEERWEELKVVERERERTVFSVRDPRNALRWHSPESSDRSPGRGAARG
jgi:hypothetical protein